MICASLNRAVFIKNLLRYLAEKILLLNTTNFRGDYHHIDFGDTAVLTFGRTHAVINVPVYILGLGGNRVNEVTFSG